MALADAESPRLSIAKPLVKMSSTIRSITIKNSRGMSATLLNYGARLKSLKVPVGDSAREMLLGYQNDSDYLTDPFYLGAVCGRVCNRISGARFMYRGQQYNLDNNLGDHCLHGGAGGFSQQFWHLQKQTEQQVCFSLVSPHLDQGFPGELSVKVLYSLDEYNRLIVEMQAETDRPTPVNLTHHAYFNLGQTSCERLLLAMDSQGFLARDSEGIPTGSVLPLSKLAVAAGAQVEVGKLWQRGGYGQIVEEQGLDHCFVMNNKLPQSWQALLCSEQSGIEMRLYSNQPALQVYSGHFLNQPFAPYQGICLEPQGYTDALNRSEFPSILVESNQRYRHITAYEFGSYFNIGW